MKKIIAIFSVILCLPFFAAFLITLLRFISYSVPDLSYVLFPFFIVLELILSLIYIYCKKPVIEFLFTFSLINIYAAIVYEKTKFFTVVIDNIIIYVPIQPILILVLGILLIIMLYYKGKFKYNLLIFFIILLVLALRFIALLG